MQASTSILSIVEKLTKSSWVTFLNKKPAITSPQSEHSVESLKEVIAISKKK